MVDAQSTVSLVALSNSIVLATINTDLARMEKTNFSRGTELQWAGSRESSSFSARGGAFFLTSLFIELKMPRFGDELLSGILPRRIQFTPYKTAARSEHLTPR
jgi:hypothetical protein